MEVVAIGIPVGVMIWMEGRMYRLLMQREFRTFFHALALWLAFAGAWAFFCAAVQLEFVNVSNAQQSVTE